MWEFDFKKMGENSENQNGENSENQNHPSKPRGSWHPADFAWKAGNLRDAVESDTNPTNIIFSGGTWENQNRKC